MERLYMSNKIGKIDVIKETLEEVYVIVENIRKISIWAAKWNDVVLCLKH